MDDALRVCEGRAKHYGPLHKVFLRVGERDGVVYIDLGDGEWHAIEVKPDGWRVIERVPVKFVRSPATRAPPPPADGGMIEQELRGLVNVRDDSDFTLIVAWLVGCFSPRGPYPILIVNGEQGSAKSTLCRPLRLLTTRAPRQSAYRHYQMLCAHLPPTPASAPASTTATPMRSCSRAPGRS